MPTPLVWNVITDRVYETGLSKGVLYPMTAGAYPLGIAWNGLISVTESPGGAELSDLYADDIKYASLRSAETLGGTVEAYTYPDEFAACDGSADLVEGVKIGQQNRATFGLCYRTAIGSAAETELTDYKLHIIYGATASPSDKAFQSINDSPEAITFSWEINTTPVAVTGHKPTASIEIDSRKVDEAKLKALEDALYGAGAKAAYLPLPDEILTLMSA